MLLSSLLILFTYIFYYCIIFNNSLNPITLKSYFGAIRLISLSSDTRKALKH